MVYYLSDNMTKGEWTKDRYACCDDIHLCIITIFFAPFVFGKNAEAAGVTRSWFIGAIIFLVPFLNVCYMLKVRAKIRRKYEIDEHFSNDLKSVLCCTLCGIVQEAHQLDKRTPGEVVYRV